MRVDSQTSVYHRQYSHYPLIALLLSVLCLLATNPVWASTSGWQPLKERVQKNPDDHRQYQAIQLDNGMKLLLISDTKAAYSMTAVALPVGSLQDPAQHAGLSHYLEHLLFLGSENYPEGLDVGHNASTDSDKTIYMASASHPWLAVTLTKFADALAAPNFDPQVSEKERHSVHHEALLHRSEDGCRIQQINRETLNPHHPFARFANGNLETLADKPDSPLLQAVKSFHQRYYSANLMVAVIYSNQPLAALAHLAVESYGRIPNRHAVVKPLTMPLAIPQDQGTMIHYVPSQAYDALQLDFVITPDPQDDLYSQTNHYLSQLITSQSEGTLASWLQRQGLANNVSAWYYPTLAGNGGLFSINVSPTKQGMLQQDTIIAAVFRYLQLLESHGVQQRYFKQMTQKMQLRARQSGYSQLNLSYITALASDLLTYPTKQVVTVGTCASRYRPTAIRQYLAQLSPNRARVWVATPQAPHDRATYFFKAPYQIKPLTQQQLTHWQRIGQNLNFELPTLNPYLPTDFSLVAVKQRPKKPQCILQTAGVRAWLMPSHYFPDQPRVDITLALRNPSAVSTTRNQLLFLLLLELAELELQGFFQQATAAGITFSQWKDAGLIIQTQGFRHKLPLLLTHLVNKCRSFTFDEARLTQVKHELHRYYNNFKQQAPHKQTRRVTDLLDCVAYGELNERHSLLDSITRAELLAYRDQLFKQASLDILAVGDLSESQLHELARALQQQLALSEKKHTENRSLVINKPIKALINQLVPIEGTALSAFYLPSGYDQLASKANALLLDNLLHSWFHDQLRTQEQLGYVAEVNVRRLGQQWGLSFTLQSAGKTPAQLYERYQAFYQQAWQRLQKLTDPREFAAYQRGLLKQLQQQPSCLTNEATPFRRDFVNERHTFDTQERLIARVKALTAEEVLRFYQQAVLEPTGLALLSQVQGTPISAGKDPKGACFATPAGWHIYPSVTALQQQLLPEKLKPGKG